MLIKEVFFHFSRHLKFQAAALSSSPPLLVGPTLIGDVGRDGTWKEEEEEVLKLGSIWHAAAGHRGGHFLCLCLSLSLSLITDDAKCHANTHSPACCPPAAVYTVQG